MTTESHALMDGKLHVYRRENSRFWQCSTYLGSFNHRTSTKEESLIEAKDFARNWYMERCVEDRRRRRGFEVQAEDVASPPIDAVAALLDRRRRRHTGPLFREAAETFLKEYQVITQGERNAAYVRQKSDQVRVHLLPFFGNECLKSAPASSRNTERTVRPLASIR